MKGRKRFTIASTLFVALTVSTTEVSARSGQPAAGDQARETLKEIQFSASKAADEADSLRRIADRLSVESQYDELMALKDNINRMVRDVSSLEAESGLSPWEKQAADKVDALLLDTAKDTQDAINYFTVVLEQDEKHSHSEIWREIGATYLAASMFTEAKDSLEKFIERRSYDPEGLYYYGKTLEQLERREEAREVFNRCIEAVKTMPSYRYREHRKWDKLARDRLTSKQPA